MALCQIQAIASGVCKSFKFDKYSFEVYLFGYHSGPERLNEVLTITSRFSTSMTRKWQPTPWSTENPGIRVWIPS